MIKKNNNTKPSSGPPFLSCLVAGRQCDAWNYGRLLVTMRSQGQRWVPKQKGEKILHFLLYCWASEQTLDHLPAASPWVNNGCLYGSNHCQSDFRWWQPMHCRWGVWVISEDGVCHSAVKNHIVLRTEDLFLMSCVTLSNSLTSVGCNFLSWEKTAFT